MRKISLAFILSLSFSLDSFATSYRFEKILSTEDGYTYLSRPSINNNGAMVFNASFDHSMQRGIFLFNENNLTNIVDNSGSIFAVGVGYLNDLNTVAYSFSSFATGQTIMTYEGGVHSTIVTGAEYWPPILGGINDSKMIMFAANIPNSHYGIATRNQTETTIITDGNIPNPVPYSIGGISGDGTVVFSSISPKGYTLYIGDGNSISPIATSGLDGEFYTLGLTGFVINELGSVAFWAGKSGEASGYFLFDGSTTHRIAPDDYPIFDTLSLNNNLDVAYLSAYFNPLEFTFRTEINAQINGQKSHILGTGESLFGERITSLEVSNHAFNEHGQISFLAGFESGEQAIVLASPIPEPSKIILLLTGLLMLTIVPRSRYMNNVSY